MAVLGDDEDVVLRVGAQIPIAARRVVRVEDHRFVVLGTLAARINPHLGTLNTGHRIAAREVLKVDCGGLRSWRLGGASLNLIVEGNGRRLAIR